LIDKYFDEQWDFRTADTKKYTHGFHSYPAIMIPQVAGSLIDKYGKQGKLLFDPYCGSGTSLVEASLRGIDSIGMDLNPLARLISKVKTTVLDLKKLDKYIKGFVNLSFQQGFGVPLIRNIDIPKFYNIDFWFDKKVQKKLALIKYFISEIKDPDISDFFKIAFSQTVRECSWTRNGEFKLYRITENKREKFNHDVFSIMQTKLIKAQKGLKDFIREKKGNAKVEIYDFNTVENSPIEIFQKRKVDIIVTSPPYGDSRTTVAYGQYSRLSNEWIGFKNANQIDRLLMGGIRKKKTGYFKSNILNKAINKIAKIDIKRVEDVISFYSDYMQSINNISPLIKNGGFVCYVVGNRKVKGVMLPTDEITKEFFESNGFEHIETVIRNIPNKRMPSKNSPTNEPGKLDSTMLHEFIVVMRKIV